MPRRFTSNDLEAMDYALNTVLAGTLDGIDEDTPEYDAMDRSLQRALGKITERLDLAARVQG